MVPRANPRIPSLPLGQAPGEAGHSVDPLG